MSFVGLVVKESEELSFAVPNLYVFTLRSINLEKGTGPAGVYVSTTNLDGSDVTMRLATVSSDHQNQDKVRFL